MIIYRLSVLKQIFNMLILKMSVSLKFFLILITTKLWKKFNSKTGCETEINIPTHKRFASIALINIFNTIQIQPICNWIYNVKNYSACITKFFYSPFASIHKPHLNASSIKKILIFINNAFSSNVNQKYFSVMINGFLMHRVFLYKYNFFM